MNKKLNFLVIITDQQRWDSLGCYGNKFVETPNIDKLAETGAKCANSFLCGQGYTHIPIIL